MRAKAKKLIKANKCPWNVLLVPHKPTLNAPLEIRKKEKQDHLIKKAGEREILIRHQKVPKKNQIKIYQINETEKNIVVRAIVNIIQIVNIRAEFCSKTGNAKNQGNLTFQELNHLINGWISDIQEIEKVYLLQSDEINKFTYNISSCHEKLQTLYKRITITKLLQENVDTNLNQITVFQQAIEKAVEKLENSLESLSEKNIPVDLYRRNTYNLAESLDSTFCNFDSVIEEIKKRTGEINYDCMCDGNIEQFAQVLQAHLQQLETIEMRAHQMKNYLNQIEYLKNRVLNSLRLREI